MKNWTQSYRRRRNSTRWTRRRSGVRYWPTRRRPNWRMKDSRLIDLRKGGNKRVMMVMIVFILFIYAEMLFLMTQWLPNDSTNQYKWSTRLSVSQELHDDWFLKNQRHSNLPHSSPLLLDILINLLRNILKPLINIITVILKNIQPLLQILIPNLLLLVLHQQPQQLLLHLLFLYLLLCHLPETHWDVLSL